MMTFGMVSQIRDKEGLVVHLIDIFDAEGTIIKSLPRIIGDKPVILVGNKMDLLPKSTNRRKLTQWLRSEAKKQELPLKTLFDFLRKRAWAVRFNGSH